MFVVGHEPRLRQFPSLIHSTPRLQHREICLRDLGSGFGVGCATVCSIVAVSTRSLQLDPFYAFARNCLTRKPVLRLGCGLARTPIRGKLFSGGGVWGWSFSGVTFE